MTLHIMTDLDQGSEAWHDARRGIVTASVVGQLISISPPSPLTAPCPECGAEVDSPCLSRARKEPAPIKTLHGSRVAAPDAPKVIAPAANDYSRALTTLLVSERITGWTEDCYVSAAMMRGTMDEPIAREHYSQTRYPVDQVGFMVLERDGWQLGYSPDGLVGVDGVIEIKSREPKAQLATVLADEVPLSNMAQIQAGLLVSGREWCDYVSWCGGMPMWVRRVYPDPRWFDAITEAVTSFEENAAVMVATYQAAVAGLPATERVNHFPEVTF